MIANFWLYKFKALGFPPETAVSFAYSIEYKSAQLKQYDPDYLPQYLREQSEKRPKNFITVPFSEYKKNTDLLKLLGRKPKDET